jgi:hypothetical protein
MADENLDLEMLKQVFVYLYRCWIEKYLGEVPSQLALSPTDGFLNSPTFGLYFNTGPVMASVAAEIKQRTKEPVLFIAPSFPSNVLGVPDLLKSGSLDSPFDRVFSIVRDKSKWLHGHRERGLNQREAYETKEYGEFSLWKGKTATRLLFQPTSSDLYGYAVIRNSSKDFFFRKSKSCKQEGAKKASGRYKRIQHRVEGRSILNIDLVYGTGEVLLLHLTLAGAGYKVFPRATPEPEPSFP